MKAQMAPFPESDPQTFVSSCMRYNNLNVFVFNPSLLFRVQETDIAEVPEN